MELQEHEVICSKCLGEVLPLGHISTDACSKCGGEGKVDWVSNAMSGKKDSLYHTGSPIFAINPNHHDNDVTFYHEGTESIRLTKDSFYIKGKKVADDDKIYDAFVNFFKQCGTYI